MLRIWIQEDSRGRTGSNVLLLAVFISLFFVFPASLLHAQATGEITGRVTDQTGAVVPNVKVTATRTSTGISQSTVTGSSGTYTLSHVLVGTYSVTATASGFKEGVAKEITLNVSQQREVNFTLVLAAVKANVRVSAAPPLLNTTNATLSGLVTQQQVENLPLNGRNISGLIYLEPGVVNPQGGMGWMGSQFVSNGNRAETLVGTLDGSDISDAEMGTLQFTNFNLDAIAEFKVLQGNYSAKYGQGGGTITQIVSKSGTNRFHGSGYDFLRNNVLDARNFFSTSVSPFQRNEFGATLGGPIIKNKTFFFGEYAGLRQRHGSLNLVPVPTAEERNGVVSIPDPNNPAQTDVLQVPMNSDAQQVLSKYPMPNQPGGVYGANTFNSLFKQPTNDDQFSVRVDQHFSDKDTFFARATWGNNTRLEADAWAAQLGGTNFSTSRVADSRNFAISETHLFSPTMLNDFTFTLNRGIEGVPEAPAEADTTSTNFSDGSLASWGPDGFETKYVVTMFDPRDSFTWTKGRQTFGFGGEFRREWDNGTGVTGDGPSGAYTFNLGTPLPVAIPSTNGGTSLAAGTPSPSGIISMMEGADQYYGRSTTVPGYGPPGGGGVWWGLRRSYLSGYVQDDIKATRRIDLNLGFRYEYSSVPTEVANRLSGPADYGKLYGHFVVNPQPLWQPDYVSGDFGPRFGFAARLSQKTILRGGFGMFTNQIITVYPDQALVDFPVASLSYDYGAAYSLSPIPVSLPELTSTSGVPVIRNGNTKTIPPNTPVNIAPFAAVLGNIGGDYASDRLKNGYTMNDNLTLEHEFPGGVAVQASYVGSIGVDLYDQWYPNAYDGALPQNTPYSRITPGLGELQVFYNGGRSEYNALQLRARKISPAHGLQFQANYTWSKVMTDSDDVWSAGWASGAMMQNNPNCVKCEWAPGSYNVTNRFVGNFSYLLPFNQWRPSSKLLGGLTHGWRMLGIFTAQSGSPFTVVSPYGSLQYGFDSRDGLGARPFMLQPATLNPGGSQGQFFTNAVIGTTNGLGTGYFGTPTITSPVNGQTVLTSPGNLGRNTFTGFGWWNFDYSLMKDTKITEALTLQFRAEFFNIFNNASYGGPGDQVLGDSNFGISTYTATTEREIQFGLRFMF